MKSTGLPTFYDFLTPNMRLIAERRFESGMYVRTYVRTHMHGEEGREKTNATEKDGEEKKDGEQMSELILN